MARRSARARLTVACAAVILWAAGASGCGLPGTATPEPTPTEEPGPTLGAQPVPGDWVDVPHRSGLIYSVPPQWLVVDEDGNGAEEFERNQGFGIVTVSNVEAQTGYCPGAPHSFRVLAGLTRAMPGTAAEVTTDMGGTMSYAMDQSYSEHGTQVEAGEIEKIGVGGAVAYHQRLVGHPHEPRNICTPPRFRVDVIGVQLGTPEEPQVVSMLLIGDLDEPGVEPESTIDQVIGSLRFNDVL